jgi:hypothetical protein
MHPIHRFRGQMSEIFLSYSSRDRERVQPLAKLLETIATVWWDPHIGHGDPWPDALRRALAEARCVVVVWTRHSVESDWVWNEANEGKNRRILVPVLMDDVEVPFGFHHLQSARLQRWGGSPDDPEVKALLRSVSQRVGPSPQPPSAAPEAPVRLAPPVFAEASRGADEPPPGAGATAPGAASERRVGANRGDPARASKHPPAADRRRADRRVPLSPWRRQAALFASGTISALALVLVLSVLEPRDDPSTAAAAGKLAPADPARPLAAVIVSDAPPSGDFWGESPYDYYVMEGGSAHAVRPSSPIGDTLRVAVLRTTPSEPHPGRQIDGIVRFLVAVTQESRIDVENIRSLGEVDPGRADEITRRMPEIRNRVSQQVGG